MNTYFARTSVFTMLVRPAGTDASGNGIPGMTSASSLQSAAPVRRPIQLLPLVHPETREYEFRFLPKNGATLASSALRVRSSGC